MVGSGGGGMWVVGSLATTRLGWDSSRFAPPLLSLPLHLPPPKLSPLPPPPPQEARGVPTVLLQRFGRVPTPGRALRDTRDDRINGIDCEHVDLQRRELGASARLRKKKLSGINKQTDRLGEHRKSPLLPPSALLISLLHITHSSI